MTLKLITAALLIQTASAFELGVGKPFPEIPLPTTGDGELQSIADFRGQKLMLHVFASW
jgi:hypothetical protein